MSGWICVKRGDLNWAIIVERHRDRSIHTGTIYWDGMRAAAPTHSVPIIHTRDVHAAPRLYR